MISVVSKAGPFLLRSNFIEEWETDRINLKNDKCKYSLLEKYIRMYLFDEGEFRRVCDIIWSSTRSAKYYQVVTAFIKVICYADS